MRNGVSVAASPYNLGPIGQVPMGEGRRFQVGPVAVAVFRARTGEVFATQAVCPHKGGPLADGTIGERTLVCPLHAYKFDLASGQPLGSDCGALTVYPVSVREDGDILLLLDARHVSAEELAAVGLGAYRNGSASGLPPEQGKGPARGSR